MSNENINATSNKRRRREDDIGTSIEIPPVSIMKRSKNDASSSNLSRVKFGHKSKYKIKITFTSIVFDEISMVYQTH